MDTELRAQIEMMSTVCHENRKALFAVAIRSVKTRRLLNLIAGILALLSAGSVMSLLSDYVAQTVMKIISVVFSTLSGFISLLNSQQNKDTEIQQLYAGASRYLALSDRAGRVLLNSSLTEKQMHASLEEMQRAYAELDHTFGRHLASHVYPIRPGKPTKLVRDEKNIG